MAAEETSATKEGDVSLLVYALLTFLTGAAGCVIMCLIFYATRGWKI
ncbi:MAG: hypothetical protein M3362_22355 [Acidobacteriota bacterium]|nr:hypothetical protein [Acidobacteriota bacterium]